MRQTLVRYKTKPDSVQENERLIAKVFEELTAKSPQDVRYLALRLNDGSFVHFSIADTSDGASPLPKLDAFRTFQSGIKERCVELPQAADATIIGSYRMLDTIRDRKDT
jgi:hypothetical protein